MKKRIMLASTVALSLALLATQAEELVWTALGVEQIQNDVTKEWE